MLIDNYNIQLNCLVQSQQPKQRSLLTLTGLAAFQKILELTKPVNGSKELWFKLGHDKFIVANYTPDGRMTAWHTKGSGKKRVRTEVIPDFWEYASRWAKTNNGGVFYIPTQPQGYPLSEAIAVSDDVAAELDEGTPEQQLQIISEFVEISGLTPAFIIHSGSKSYHPHWKATEHLPIAQTKYLRKLICIALSSDPAIANPHQPMRLAGFYRREKGREQTLESWSEARYTYAEFIGGIKAYFEAKGIPFPEDISEERWRIYKRARKDDNRDLSLLILPESELYPKPKYEPTPSPSVNIPAFTGSIPLELALSLAHQEALKGVGSERNNTGLAVALDLIGCHDWLVSNNYLVDGAPYSLFIDYCTSCTPGGGWSSREWESVWRSASSRRPTPARGDLSSFVHWYRWNNDPDYKQACIAEWKKNNPQPAPKSEQPSGYQEYLAREEEQEKIDEAISRSEPVKLGERADFTRWLVAQAKGLGKNFRKGFGQYSPKKAAVKLPRTIKYSPENPLPSPKDYEGQEPPLIKFSRGQRLQVVNKLRELGWQFLLDRSFMGLGKSHNMGQFTNTQGQTWYLDLNHRNPSVATVEKNFADLPVRHGGLVQDPYRQTALGNPFLKWAKEDCVSPDIKSLCHNSHLFLKLQNKGYSVDSLHDFEEGKKLNPICKNCQFNKVKVDSNNGEKIAICAAQKGDGFGFRSARKEGLAKHKVRANINSLPDPQAKDYSKDIAIVEEASQVIRGTTTVEASLKDFSTKMLELEKFPGLFRLLKPIREKLIPLLSGAEKLPNYYGLSHQELIDLLPTPTPEVEEVIEVLSDTLPSWEEIEVAPARVKGWGRKWRSSMKTANWYLQKEAQELTNKEVEKLPANFLIPLLQIWAGLRAGAIRIDSYRNLIVTTEDYRHGEILRSMQQVILLDATGNKRILAQRLGIEASSIIEIQEELPPLSNLRVVNVQLEGMASNQWSETCQVRIKALINYLEKQHPDIPLIGLKKYAGALELDGWWFNDNRGSNSFKGESALAAFGKPQINIGVVQDEYLTLYGTLDGFEEYYQSLVNSEVTQLVGRQRAHQFPEQNFITYLVGTGLEVDYLESFGIKVSNCHAFDLTPAAGTKGQISKYKIIQALSKILDKEGKITAQSLAKESGLSTEYIKDLTQGVEGLVAFKKWGYSLYAAYRTYPQKSPPNFLAQEKIRKWMDLNPREAVKEIWEAVQDLGWRDFHEYLSLFTVDIQAKIWALIAPSIFPEGAISELEKALSPPVDIRAS